VDELAALVDDPYLVGLEAADEVPAERRAVDGMLGLELLRAVLPDDLDPGIGQERHVAERHVFVAATIVTPAPTSARSRR